MVFKNIKLNLFSSYMLVLVSIVFNMSYIPLSINYLGAERYGEWITIFSLFQFLSVTNLGIPNIVTTLLMLANSYLEKAAIYSKGFHLLKKISLNSLFICILIFIVFKIRNSSLILLSKELDIPLIVLTIFFFLKMPFQISNSAFISEKKIYLVKLFEFSTIALNYLALLITIYLKEDLVFLSLLSSIFLLALNFFSYLYSRSILKLSLYQHSEFIIESSKIYKPGISLMISGIGAMVIWNSDNLVILKYLGAQEVAIYSTAFRLFSFAFLFCGLLTSIVVPYFADLFKAKQYLRLKILLETTLIIIPFISLFFWLIFWLFSKEIIYLWIGNLEYYKYKNLYFVLGIYALVLAHVSVMNSFLVTVNEIKYLVYITYAEAILNLILSLYFINKFGVIAVAFGTLISSFFITFIFLTLTIQRNKNLKFNFPFAKISLNFILYLFMMFILFYFEIINYTFTSKIVVTIFYMFILFFTIIFLNNRLLGIYAKRMLINRNH